MPPIVAPYPCLLLPLSNHPDLMQTVQKMRTFSHSNHSFLSNQGTVLKEHGIAHRVDDSAGSIGRRYARNDEQGTPFAITVDFDTLNDGQVTLRERDSCHQVRLPVRVYWGEIINC
jgi:glycyl-tRNA synthetase